jgi:hypothetical protein
MLLLNTVVFKSSHTGKLSIASFNQINALIPPLLLLSLDPNIRKSSFLLPEEINPDLF